MRTRRLKKKYKKILYLIIVLVIGTTIFNSILKLGEKSSKEPERLNLDFLGQNIGDVLEYSENHNLNTETHYEYNDDVLENVIIKSENIDGKIIITVSKGKVPESVYIENKVNELGKVPIMMYHGIVNTTTTKYVGGNVDKDGYNRTADAFRNDLEFYYNSGYRMVRLIDYVNGIIDVPLGYSPIILTFDDGNKNNFNVLGRNADGTLEIDPNCAVGILEKFKEKYPDYNVTATFFLMSNLFNQKEYNEEIMKWLVEHNYDIGNHTINHANFSNISISKTQEVVGKMYQQLDNILKDTYVKIIALPYGSPYNKNHSNYKYILKGSYEKYQYETISALRVGWESEVSPFNKSFDKTFLKRCRAYDNNGTEFDIEMVFKGLQKTRYISDGNINKIVIKNSDSSKLNNNLKNVVSYGD